MTPIPSSYEGPDFDVEPDQGPEFAPGTMVGSYRVGAPIAYGGMGTVYAAQDLRLGRAVAIKVLHATLGAYSELVQRFLQEAHAIARVGHPGLVELHAAGDLPDGRPYLVMELLPGTTLREQLDQGEPSADVLFAIFEQLTETLAAVHAAGVVHRDLKPENVVVVERAGRMQAKLLDFGVCKVTDLGPWSPKTRVGTQLGTPRYMAPEQLDAAETAVDHRADLYALGLMMYEAFTGEWPWQTQGTGNCCIVAHLNLPPKEPKALARRAPRLAALLMDCLARNPDDRPPNAASVGRRLAQAHAEWQQEWEWRCTPAAAPALADGIFTVLRRAARPS